MRLPLGTENEVLRRADGGEAAPEGGDVTGSVGSAELRGEVGPLERVGSGSGTSFALHHRAMNVLKKQRKHNKQQTTTYQV
jgi:hypothetical protein